jgi:hypothetical protein
MIKTSRKNMESIIQELYALSKQKFMEQGADQRNAYKAMVAESIHYFLERGKLTDDDNLEFIENRLLKLWPQLQEEISFG